MIENVKKLKKQKDTCYPNIYAFIGPIGCRQTTCDIDCVNFFNEYKALFVSLLVNPINLSEKITNDNVVISDKMVGDEKKLYKYDFIIIDGIQLLSKDKTIKGLNIAKKAKSKLNGFLTCMFVHLNSNKKDINYGKEHQNSQYIREIADEVRILKKDDYNDNDILGKIEKSNFEELDDVDIICIKWKIKRLFMEE